MTPARDEGPTLQRKSPLCIPFLGIALPQPQFQHLYVCERFIQSQDWYTYFLQQNRETDRGNICINRSQTHECGNWDWDPIFLFWEYLFRNYRYFVFAVSSQIFIELPVSWKWFFLHSSPKIMAYIHRQKCCRQCEIYCKSTPAILSKSGMISRWVVDEI